MHNCNRGRAIRRQPCKRVATRSTLVVYHTTRTLLRPEARARLTASSTYVRSPSAASSAPGCRRPRAAPGTAPRCQLPDASGKAVATPSGQHSPAQESTRQRPCRLRDAEERGVARAQPHPRQARCRSASRGCRLLPRQSRLLLLFCLTAGGGGLDRRQGACRPRREAQGLAGSAPPLSRALSHRLEAERLAVAIDVTCAGRVEVRAENERVCIGVPPEHCQPRLA